VKSFPNFFDLFRHHSRSTTCSVSLETSIFQQMLMPKQNCVSIWQMTAVLLMKLAMNSNRKFELCWPVKALNLLLQCEWYHFTQASCLLLNMCSSVTTLKNLVSLFTFHGKLATCKSNWCTVIPHLY
jgi:hypothetical protein